jgi:hypothetical protein
MSALNRGLSECRGGCGLNVPRRLGVIKRPRARRRTPNCSTNIIASCDSPTADRRRRRRRESPPIEQRWIFKHLCPLIIRAALRFCVWRKTYPSLWPPPDEVVRLETWGQPWFDMAMCVKLRVVTSNRQIMSLNFSREDLLRRYLFNRIFN